MTNLKSFIFDRVKDKESDFGISRVALFILFFGAFTALFSFLFLNGAPLSIFIFPFFALLLFLLRPLYQNHHPITLFMIFILFSHIFVISNYFFIGEIDRLAGLLPRLDAVPLLFDHLIFGKVGSLYFEEKFRHLLGEHTFYLYDLLSFSYLIYFISPILVGTTYFRLLRGSYLPRIGRCFMSFIIYYSINLFSYLLIPVTGPQYYAKSEFVTELPFGALGNWIHALVASGQTTLIDCFPSGHFGILLLSTFWFYKMRSKMFPLFIFLTLLMFLATIGLRYHYLLDLIASVPLAFLCFRAGHLFYKVDYR